MLYLRDRPFLNYHFGKLGKEGWAALANPDPAQEPDPNAQQALRAFLAPYDLPEHRVKRVPKAAAVDFMAALKRRRVPAWVLNMAPIEEIEEVSRT